MDYGMAHLHVHTDASLRDGMGTVPRLLDRAKTLGMTAIGMTDHGTLANAVSFSIEARRRSIKPLLGLEGYVYFDDTIGHITLLADGEVGWNSLLALNNLSHVSNYKQPAFTIDELVENQAGLVCLTGCIASPLQRLSFKEARRLAGRLKGAFGHRLFAELMFVGDSLGWERPLRLADAVGLKTVMTNDVHFPDQRDADVHSILTRMKSGFEYDSQHLFLRSYDEMRDAAVRFGIAKSYADEMLNRTKKIGELLQPINLKRTPALPTASVKRSLNEIILETPRFKELYSDIRYWERYQTELDIIQRMDYEDYFLILNDIVWVAKERGVKVGPGRGSGAGSLILYLLGITDVDPIKFGLQFERFLNPEREGMPDVDVDLESERRSAVLDYAHDEYGAVPIATYSRYSHKSLTRDLGRMFRADKDLIAAAAENGDGSAEFAQIMADEPLFAQAYEAFYGQIRHKGKHAGGVIITDTPVPIERLSKDEVAAAWTEGQNSELSHAGIVKFDLLGLSVLTALRSLEEELDTIPPEPVEFAPEFGLFRDGNLSGVFQFAGSDGIRELTMKIAPTKFEELIAINAVYRPGAIDAGALKNFPIWKETPRKVPSYIHHVLEETYGAIVYQEQVMEIFRLTVGGTLGEADLARRVITKSKVGDPDWEEKLASLRLAFLKGAEETHHLKPKEARELWAELETHSRYSFNKAHSTAYAMIAWQCAWWKFNYPAHFLAAILNTDPANEQTYIINAIQDYGIKIAPPHVNESGAGWTGHGDRIRMPLGSIKFLGQVGVDAIISEREAAGGAFTGITHFMDNVPKKFVRARAREGLLSLGGFKGLFEEPKLTDEIIKILALKKYPDHMRPKRERQLQYLGFIVPDTKMLAEFKRYEAKGWACGIVKSRDKRSSKFGAYVVYHLSPKGVFWSRDVTDLEKGEVLAVNISEKNGRAKTIRRL
jgi:DNA polymerase-3 subunit alpha